MIKYFQRFGNKFRMTQFCSLSETQMNYRKIASIMLSNQKAFTLVELIVIITILAILGTIAFVSLQGYSKSARDTKRLSDVKSLITKITIENTKGVNFTELITTETGYSMEIYGVNDEVVFGIPRFENLNENSGSFQDPSSISYVDPTGGKNYLFAYSTKTQRVAGMYTSETTGKNICIGEVLLFDEYEEECNGSNNGEYCNTNSTTDNRDSCNDIEIGDYIVMDRNLGATSNDYTNSNSYGYHFQFGRNKGFTSTGSISQQSIQISGNINGNDMYGFIANDTEPQGWNWANTDIDNNWGGNDDSFWENGPGTNLDRQGPCPNGYHIPSTYEWKDLIGKWFINKGAVCNIIGQGDYRCDFTGDTSLNNFQYDLKLPSAGIRSRENGVLYSQGSRGNYWSSSINSFGFGAYKEIFFTSSYVYAVSSSRYPADGQSIRCFKN